MPPADLAGKALRGFSSQKSLFILGNFRMTGQLAVVD
jgi:hypothetical protein